MCGIAGIVDFSGQPVDQSLLLEMLKKQHHRGPDASGYFVQDNVGLAHNRLSILDLSTAADQPFYSADKRFVLVFNGEIYNYLELKETLKDKYTFQTTSDTEVLLYSYLEWGERCLDRFNGMFSFAIYDTQEKVLFAARDRFGIKPFYYYLDDKRFVFASEIPPLLCALPHKPSANEQAVFDFLSFNITDHSPETLFEGIVKLSPGCRLKMTGNQMEISRWYDIAKQKAQPFKDPQEFRELLSDAVGLQMRADVPVGVCLSGGMDSTTVVSLMLNDHKKQDLHTFSAVYPEAQGADESRFIHCYRSQVQNMHFVTPDADSLFADLDDFVQTHAEPLTSTALYAQYKVLELAGKHVKVTVDGQGADEHLAGYLYFFGFYFKSLFTRLRWIKLFRAVKGYFKHHKTLMGLKSFVFVMLPAKLQTRLRVASKGGINKALFDKYGTSSQSSSRFFGGKDLTEALLNHVQYKLDHLLKWHDRNSMRFSVESRVPFLDHRLVERTLAGDSDWLIRDGVTKYILRQSVKDILPEPIVNRQEKVGFMTPEGQWFREERFRVLFSDIIDCDICRARGILDVDKVMGLYDRHLKGEINISQEIWKWLNIELWYRRFID